MLRRAIFMLLSSDFMQNILHFVPLFLHFGDEPQLCVRAVEILPRAVDAEVNIVIKSQYGLTNETSQVIPYLFHIRYYRQKT